MRSKGQNRSFALTILVDAGMVLAALAVLSATANAPLSPPSASAGIGLGVTHLRVTDQVVLPRVTRLGINLGEQNYYDSGQMMRNLLYRNPGFEGMAYRSILHCLSGGPSNCTDTRHIFTWPSGFWDGARFEVLDGGAAGRRGGVRTSGPSGSGFGLTLDGTGPAIGAGDWVSVS